MNRALAAQRVVHAAHVGGGAGARSQPDVRLVEVLGGGDAGEGLRAAIQPGLPRRIEHLTGDPHSDLRGAGVHRRGVAHGEAARVQERGVDRRLAWRAVPAAGDQAVAGPARVAAERERRDVLRHASDLHPRGAYLDTSRAVPGWARSAAVMVANCAGVGDWFGPPPGPPCWICTGTVADTSHFSVVHCHSPYPGVITHVGKLLKESLVSGQKIIAEIDSARRQLIANNHTATHLLHFALQQVLGSHIQQAGSVVDANRLRFDFNHHKALSKEEVRHIEIIVNEKIRENQSVKVYEIAYEEAQKHKEIKQFFGEKYANTVRVIDMDYSKELCGGTHTSQVGTIGLFRIAKESSISAGVRRIEAVTGAMAETMVYETEDLVEQSADLLKTPPAKLVDRITALSEENKSLSHELKQLKRKALKHLSKELLQTAQKAGNIPLITAIVTIDTDLIKDLMEDLSSQLHSGVILLGVKTRERCQLIAKISSDWVQKGVQAVELIKEIAPSIEGSGGGKDSHAQAGGKNPEGLAQAFEKAKRWLEKKT